MTRHALNSQRVVAAAGEVIAIDRRPPQPDDPGWSVCAPALRFVLHDQACGTSCTAANAQAAPFRERRRPGAAQDSRTLRTGLTPQQLHALATLEQFQWSLRFVRRPMFQAPVPIVFSPDDTRFIVIEADGAINENPSITIRP